VNLWKRRTRATKKGGERQKGRGEHEQQKMEERDEEEKENKTNKKGRRVTKRKINMVSNWTG
jgi:hypothetical protein